MKEYRYEQEQAVITKTGIEFFLQKMPNSVGRVNPHVHSAIEILYIVKGRFRMFADDTEVVVGEGCTVLFRSNAVHKIFPLSPGESFYYVLKVKPALIMDFSSPDERGSYLMDLALRTGDRKVMWTAKESEDSGISAEILNIAKEAERRDYGYDIAMKAGAARVLLAILRDTRPIESRLDCGLSENNIRRIYDVTVYINSHYGENLTAADCAARAIMSVSYFSRCFAKVTGKSFKDYLNTVRVGHAEKALATTDRSVTEIAADCGFSNVSYFISVYKKLKGITPLAARKA
ncbi:MAG: helix-turn-helix transcriptional regulator [Clostridia bacterium]|nr:helix-turn-helix transcriptional regulator [Clostridia bacterium]